jgi:hypothetical protein
MALERYIKKDETKKTYFHLVITAKKLLNLLYFTFDTRFQVFYHIAILS